MEGYKSQSVERATQNEEKNPLIEEITSLEALDASSGEKLIKIFNAAKENPDYFGGNEEMTATFRETLSRKIEELKSGPDIMQEKINFAEKWKLASLGAGAASVMGLVGSAAFTSRYGFDATPMIEAFNTQLNLPMVASTLAAYTSVASLGIAKVRQVLCRRKQYNLSSSVARFA